MTFGFKKKKKIDKIKNYMMMRRDWGIPAL